MNIIIFIDSLHSIAAGSEKQIYKLAEGLANTNHKVKLVLLRHTTFSQNLINFPCPIECLDITSIASFDAAKKMLAFRRELKKQRIDVVHAYFPDACLLAPLFLKMRHCKVITSRRDMGLIYKGNTHILYRVLGFRTDLIISNSIAVAHHIERIERLPAKKTRVIYNGLEIFDKTPSGKAIFSRPHSFKLVLVANIKPVKRTLDAVKATHQLIANNMDIELCLVGEHQDKNYVDGILNYIAQNNLSNHITLIGSFDEPRRILNQANIGLLVSDSEGLSNTIMEYMQLGLPVIATNVGGNPELVQHNINGLLVEKGDVGAIAKAIEMLYQDKKLAVALGQKGKEIIESNFSIKAMIQKHENLYSEKNHVR